MFSHSLTRVFVITCFLCFIGSIIEPEYNRWIITDCNNEMIEIIREAESGNNDSDLFPLFHLAQFPVKSLHAFCLFIDNPKNIPISPFLTVHFPPPEI